ncbi:AAA family ATPase [Rhizobium tumorigenes]|uniref:AAA family ATPase n=1 Tax=Rhizobium tumorigenes TaxID=2041385 RepID=A0AAF1KRY0_9HYPH|nr:AAA family ATPase [Rhizobium tumorigenes]WFR96728.1 AAA family ATPase [Rhizobium tumorigenes]
MTALTKPEAPNYLTDIADVAERIGKASRIMVIGCSGGGKSTLSQYLAARFGLTYVSIDRDILWLPGWAQRDRQEQRRLMAEKAQEERWVFDGTGPSTFDIRLPRTDLVIWVRMPRLLCIWGVTQRWLRWIGRTRPEMAPGCPEKIDWEFLRYVWTFDDRFAPQVVASLVKNGPDVPVFQLNSRRQMRRLLDLLGPPA